MLTTLSYAIQNNTDIVSAPSRPPQQSKSSRTGYGVRRARGRCGRSHGNIYAPFARPEALQQCHLPRVGLGETTLKASNATSCGPCRFIIYWDAVEHKSGMRLGYEMQSKRTLESRSRQWRGHVAAIRARQTHRGSDRVAVASSARDPSPASQNHTFKPQVALE